ncbi:hypothetical protein [Streptomyces sp. NPDC051569]|uniref:hypothetical protein n=1 Tax=Streptomyces sp. NPDC051569 TaxID=3365661 RepID=UPI003795D102
MRAIRAASAALLGAAALALGAPTATASADGKVTPFGFSVTPSTVAAGGRVTLAVTRCATPATASSGVFDTVTIPSGGTAAATVDWDAKAGAMYEVTFTCDGVSGRTELTVAGATRRPTPTPVRDPSRTPARTPAVAPTAASTRTAAAVADPPSASPGGVQGGLGGSVGGTRTGELVAGTALVVAAATGVVHAARRRAESRRH